MLAVGLAFPAPAAHAQSGKTEVLWLGQSAFRIPAPGGKVIVTDPQLIKNPLTPAQFKSLEAPGKVDVILVSHGHGDHIADAPALAKLNNIPMRSGANPLGKGTPKEYMEALGDAPVKVFPLKPGEKVYF